ncbi:MAG: hypothetical protein KH084_15605 [Enterococcus gallinarum]|nr:hypothetical protein [Enterococcus gallinarum]
MELMISIVPHGTFASLFAIFLLSFSYPIATEKLPFRYQVGEGVLLRGLIDFSNHTATSDPKYQLA